jgi:hypothetical protein
MGQDKRTLDFLGLFVRHQQEIYAYILTLVPHVSDADDLFQDGTTVMWSGQVRQVQPHSLMVLPRPIKMARHSCRRATIGSIRAARQAGT